MNQKPWLQKVLAYSWLSYFCFPLVALALGWAKWELGPRAVTDFAALKIVVQAILFFAFVYFALISPLKKWVWIEETPLTSYQLIAFSSLVLSLPLISFAYWVGEVRTLLQAQEVTVSVIPPVVFSVLIFYKTRSVFEWALSLSSMVFFHLFLINEILGPFKTYFYLFAHDYRFEYLRFVYPACTIAAYYRWQLGVNTIHHPWKRSRFAKMFKTADPRKSALEAETKS